MEKESKHLKFVLKHYAPGLFDTRKALREYESLHRQGRKLWTRTIGIAATVAVCLSMAYYLFAPTHNEMVRLYADNESLIHHLPDGSEVKLFPHSALSYDKDDFGKENRQVEMSGKIGFKVTKNPAAPFTASTNRCSVRVLGTEFVIDEVTDESLIQVNVSSGKVLFTAKGQNEGVVLTAGMSACLLDGKTTPEVTDRPKRHFNYDNTPLNKVLKELSEYFGIKLECPTATADKALTAEFNSDDELDEIIVLIEQSLDVKIEKLRPNKDE